MIGPLCCYPLAKQQPVRFVIDAAKAPVVTETAVAVAFVVVAAA